MVDLFTRFGLAAPIPDQTAPTVVDMLLARWILLLGAPGRILSDQDANFESAQVQDLCALWRIEKVRTTSSHLAGKGACERLKQSIKRGLQSVLHGEHFGSVGRSAE